MWDGASGVAATIGLPTSVPCTSYKGNCQCIHAVACAACHTTTSGGSEYVVPNVHHLHALCCVVGMCCTDCLDVCLDTIRYIPPTSVELWACDLSATHISWSSLSVNGASHSQNLTGLLMADGLCLEASSQPKAIAQRQSPVRLVQ